MGPFAQQDLAGSCRLLESGRDVHSIPGHRACGTGARGDDDLASVDADAHRHADAKLGLQAAVQRSQGIAHLERGPDRPKGIVLVDKRHAKDGKDSIANDLLDGPAMPLED
jgi:hypothetical protein